MLTKRDKRNKLYLAMRSSFSKKNALLPRKNGTHRVSKKYMRKRGGNRRTTFVPRITAQKKLESIKTGKTQTPVTPITTSTPYVQTNTTSIPIVTPVTMITTPHRTPIKSVMPQIIPPNATINSFEAVIPNGNSTTMTVSESQIKNSPFSTNSSGKVKFNVGKMQQLKNISAKGYNWTIKNNEGLLWKECMAYKHIRQKIRMTWKAALEREILQIKKARTFQPEEIERITKLLNEEYPITPSASDCIYE